jgi:spore coat polysaccharide biosynthesis protein SpsF
VVAIVQARMGSTRLPGKVLAPVLGRPLLSYLVERLRRCRFIDEAVIATTTEPKDSVIVEYCASEGVSCFRGSELDVLERYAVAARSFHADIVVRISADSPVIDPALVDEMVDDFVRSSPPCDYLSNTIAQTYPLGMNAEVFSSIALRAAAANTTLPYDREHVTPYIYHNPNRFRICTKHHVRDLSATRLTVDTPEDFTMVASVIERLYPANPEFGLGDIIALLDAQPSLRSINAHICQTSTARTPA